MGHKGGLGHLKRLPAPSFWPIHRKEFAWAPKPSPGPHRARISLPLRVIVRDALRLGRTAREADMILSQEKVRVDGRVRTEKNLSVGLMDVVEIPDANLTYRVVPVPGKGMSPQRIPKDEGKFKLCKIIQKTTIAQNQVQLNTHDGRNIILPAQEAKADYKTGDTLRLSIPAQRILNHIKLEKGNLALIVSGRNLGKSGKITNMQEGTATRPAMITIEQSDGSKVETTADYAIVIGTDKPLIKLEV